MKFGEHKWFTSYLSNCFHYVQVGTLSSSLVPLTTGVPQEFTLSPILFLMHVNDVFTINRNCKIVLFADDRCIGVPANNSNTLFNLCNTIFCDCSEWFSSNMLALNIKQTSFVIIGHVANNQYLTLSFNKGIINRVSSVKYFGVIIDNKLKWDEHISYIVDKCSKGIGLIKCARYSLPIKCLVSLYYSFVYPYFQNGIEFYGTACKKYVSKFRIIQKTCILTQLNNVIAKLKQRF